MLAMITLVSCQKQKENPETAIVNNKFKKEREAFFNSLQAPAEVASKLQATAAEYYASLINNPQSYGSYTGDPVKAAANLGVYLSDLNYSIAYKQSADTKELFTAAHELSKVVGIEQTALDFLMRRYSENIAQNDSVKKVVGELYMKATTDLKGTDKETLVGIAMAGYQIENLYLALGILNTYPKDLLPTDARIQILVPLFNMVLDQQQNIEITLGFLNSISDPTDPNRNPNYAFYANAYLELIDVYKKLNVNEKIANNQGTELMNDAVVQELIEKVSVIRNKVTS
jgi:hypothetical protein